ncbi:MAG: DUF177 domain-containing protein [Desulfobacterales bacterium]|nr:DUF177 domain-containing protein [Desulfobacterales bacterium]
MILHISTLTNSWSERLLSEPKARFSSLKELEANEEIEITTPIEIALKARMVGTHVDVKGDLSFAVRHTCGRCLVPFEEKFNLKMSFLFVEENALEGTPLEEEVELTEESIGRESFTGDKIDLSLCIQDEVIMALPQNPLCRQNCKGLCKVCGQNLNEKTCKCDTQVGHPAFAKLKVLKGGKG